MPVFEAVKGGQIWVPAGAVMFVESAPGGLTSNIRMIPPPGSPGFATVEVKGTVTAVGAALDAALGTAVRAAHRLVE